MTSPPFLITILLFLRCGYLRYSLSPKPKKQQQTNSRESTNKNKIFVSCCRFLVYLLATVCLIKSLVFLAQTHQTPPLCHCACSFKQQQYFFVHLFTVHFHCSHGRHYNINTIFCTTFHIPQVTVYIYIFIYN